MKKVSLLNVTLIVMAGLMTTFVSSADEGSKPTSAVVNDKADEAIKKVEKRIDELKQAVKEKKAEATKEVH